MDAEIPRAQIDAAQEYEDHFVPALFGAWAPRLADLARIAAGQHVLDVACGTGVLAREAARRVGPGGSVAGLDPGAGMLAVAARLAPGVEWRSGTAEALPYPDRRFDAVVSQFGLMFFTDRPKALHEMLRVLKPGGRLAVSVWASIDRAPAFADLVAILDRRAGPRAGHALRAPFALGDANELTRLVGSVRELSATVTTQPGTARFTSIRFLVEAELRGWLPLMGVVLDKAQIRQILAEAEQALSRYTAADGTMTFDMAAHVIGGAKAS